MHWAVQRVLYNELVTLNGVVVKWGSALLSDHIVMTG